MGLIINILELEMFFPSLFKYYDYIQGAEIYVKFST
jgi:hypothetical protein